MARERWYPSLITLADGRVLSVSGRGADGELQRVAEIFTLGKGWKRTPEHFLMPFYPQLTLLSDGRLFYSGGYMGARHGAEPAIWNWKTGASTPVPGLPDLEMRSQAASVLLPPGRRAAGDGRRRGRGGLRITTTCASRWSPPRASRSAT